MAELDRRIIIVELEVPGGKKRFENMAVEYSVTKTSGCAMNEAEIKIANLARADRDYLVTATSPLSRPRSRKSVAVFAGYQSTGITRRFAGDVVSATVSQPPDIWLTLKAKTGYFARGDIMARSAAPQTNLSALSGDIAKDLGLTLDFQAADKGIANYSYTGAAAGQVDRLGQTGAVDAYIDDDRLVIKDRGKGLAGRRRKLSEETGMIGIPELDEKGVKVKMLIDPYTTIGSQLEIESRMNPAANGIYTVFSIKETAASRNTPFYLEAVACRPGLGGYPR